MIINNNSNLTFKGFDNVFSGRISDGNASMYSVSMRLNNENGNDLDEFSKLVPMGKEDTLTIHCGAVDNSDTFVLEVNDEPVLITSSLMKNVESDTLKQAEKTSIPLTQKVVDLLKRVIADPEPKSDHSLATYTVMSNVVDSMCRKNSPNRNFVRELVCRDSMFNGDSTVIKDSAQNILSRISDEMINYFM
ncbi:MAG: hypothetical protein NC191_05980 [Muribaculaceae bacterium]|nr:hypothetical protein [Muribaculaceae bacterium]